MFNFSIEQYGFEWNGAHTVNVFVPILGNIDVFSLNYGRDDYTPQEVMAYAYEYVQERIAEEVMS